MARPFVDRIEGDVAVLIVDGAEKRVPRASLPEDAREGVYLTDDLKRVDADETAAASARVAAKRAALKSDDGGDFSL